MGKIKTKKKNKNRNKTKRRRNKKKKKRKVKSRTKILNQSQYNRQMKIEKLLNEKNARKILPKNFRIFSWLTPNLLHKFNSIKGVDNPNIYEMSVPAG